VRNESLRCTIATVQISEPEAGLVIAAYETIEDLAMEAQEPLVTRLEQAVAKGPTCIVVVFTPAVRSVPIELPTYWLGVASKLKLTGSAIVANTMAVRSMGKGFALANQARGEAPVEVFHSEAEAVSWSKAALAKKRASSG
jgi:hypothetical protein